MKAYPILLALLVDTCAGLTPPIPPQLLDTTSFSDLNNSIAKSKNKCINLCPQSSKYMYMHPCCSTIDIPETPNLAPVLTTSDNTTCKIVAKSKSTKNLKPYQSTAKNMDKSNQTVFKSTDVPKKTQSSSFVQPFVYLTSILLLFVPRAFYVTSLRCNALITSIQQQHLKIGKGRDGSNKYRPIPPYIIWSMKAMTFLWLTAFATVEGGNTCTCPNGTPTVASGSGATLCDTNNQIDCSLCDEKYTLSDTAAAGSSQTCVANICTCLNGSPKNIHNKICKVNNQHDCSTCHTGFSYVLIPESTDRWQCLPKPCIATQIKNSNKAVTGSITGKMLDSIVVTCDAGYSTTIFAKLGDNVVKLPKKKSGTVYCQTFEKSNQIYLFRSGLYVTKDWPGLTCDKDKIKAPKVVSLSISTLQNDKLQVEITPPDNYAAEITHYKGDLLVAYPNKPIGEFQSIASISTVDLESFVIGDKSYLAAANYGTEAVHTIDSIIYQYDPTRTTDPFQQIQAIPTKGARSFTSFKIIGKNFLVVANANEDGDSATLYDQDSIIYEYVATRDKNPFVAMQSIPTFSAYDWEHFSIDGKHYLVVANSMSQNTGSKIYNQNSIVYQYDAARAKDKAFEVFQSISTIGAYDWEYMNIGADEHYLIVANSCGASSTSGTCNNLNSESVIYKYW